MKKYAPWGLWAVLYAACVALSLLTQEDTAGTAKNLLALGFFLPGIYLIIKGSRQELCCILGLSAASLLLTVICIIAGVLTATAVHPVLDFFTALCTAPMLLCSNWGISLFLWACLLFGSISRLKKVRN